MTAESGAQELVYAYIAVIGDAEPNYDALLPHLDIDHPLYPSMVIGQGCMKLASEYGRQAEQFADSCFRRADAVIDTRLRQAESPCQEGPLSLLQHTARFLLCRDEPSILAYLQADLHERTVDTIAWLHSRMTEPRFGVGQQYSMRKARGTLAQQTALGLYTRNPLSGVLATAALTHHDRGPHRPQNYDLLVVSGKNEVSEAHATKLQIKAFCLGLDPAHSPKEDARSLYAEDIALVSGCCDLDLWESTENLLAEHDEAASMDPARQSALDAASDHMVALATGRDTWDRYGRASIAPNTMNMDYLRLIEKLVADKVTMPQAA